MISCEYTVYAQTYRHIEFRKPSEASPESTDRQRAFALLNPFQSLNFLHEKLPYASREAIFCSLPSEDGLGFSTKGYPQLHVVPVAPSYRIVVEVHDSWRCKTECCEGLLCLFPFPEAPDVWIKS